MYKMFYFLSIIGLITLFNYLKKNNNKKLPKGFTLKNQVYNYTNSHNIRNGFSKKKNPSKY